MVLNHFHPATGVAFHVEFESKLRVDQFLRPSENMLGPTISEHICVIRSPGSQYSLLAGLIGYQDEKDELS